MRVPSNWREALGGELTAAQRLAEFAKVRAATGCSLLDWFRASALDHCNGDHETWTQIPMGTWAELAGELADDAAAERQRLNL